MALELVTGYWGQEHVTADQDADLNAGVIGNGMYVLPIGEKMRAEAVTSNKIRIFDGVFMGYGRQCQIEEGAFEDIEIENGTAGLLRNDMIIVKYAKDEATGTEGVSFGVLKGQTGTTATDPVPNNQDIRTGAFESEMPLYRVKLNGLAIEAIQALYSVPKALSELTTSLTQLNSNIQDLANLSNMKMVWVNQSGTYTFPLPVGKMAIVCTYNGIYPHYSSLAGISANQLGVKGTETVITSVDSTARKVSVYNNSGGATQAVILMPI